MDSQPVTLSPGGGVTDVSNGDSSGGAQPSNLSSDGSSFSVAYVGTSATAATSTATGGYDPSTGGTGGYGYDPGTSGYGQDPGAGGYGYDPGTSGYGYDPGTVGGIDPAAAAAVLSQ